MCLQVLWISFWKRGAITKWIPLRMYKVQSQPNQERNLHIWVWAITFSSTWRMFSPLWPFCSARPVKHQFTYLKWNRMYSYIEQHASVHLFLRDAMGIHESSILYLWLHPSFGDRCPFLHTGIPCLGHSSKKSRYIELNQCSILHVCCYYWQLG